MAIAQEKRSKCKRLEPLVLYDYFITHKPYFWVLMQLHRLYLLSFLLYFIFSAAANFDVFYVD